MTKELPPISLKIWEDKYRLKDLNGTPIDQTPDDTFRRVATALAEAEKPSDRSVWQEAFYEVMKEGHFIPAGRIIAGAGSGRNVTLSNCLAGETLILTGEYGLVPISEIAGETVHVLDGNGTWVEAPINAFGEQPVAPVTFRGGYNMRDRKTVYATAEHRWILQDGSECLTKNLKPGDELKTVVRSDVDTESESYCAGVQHGIVYGDGSQRPEGEIKIRLCGQKNDLAGFFMGNWARTSPPSVGEDYCLYLGRKDGHRLDLKNLPGEGSSVEYLTGFLRGWMATDGCVARGKALISCGAGEAEWLRRFGPIAGMEVTCVTKLPDETNYGVRNKTIFNVHFLRNTMIDADFLLPSHREKFEAATYPWFVLSVGERGDPEPVFCPRVLTTDSVQLDRGLHTGQCFTMGAIPDSMEGIFESLKEAAVTMQAGGGIGYDFSTLRPKGAPVKGVGADASGPLTFMDVWDSMCRTVMSAGSRRGAMMATMRCDHPDIEDFIEAKSDPARLRMFNLSVLVTDDFMAAIKGNKPWPLVFGGHTYRIVEARDLWNKIMESTYAYAEPGVIFIDRVNDDHNIGYLETIATTNPCGEKPMGPYASCLLGSVNLAMMTTNPYSPNATINVNLLRAVVRTAIRMMDNVIDVGRFPLPQQLEKAKQDRQLGLGVTGLADALLMMGIEYGTEKAADMTEDLMRVITLEAYEASIKLAKEKGSFPTFKADGFLAENTFAGRMLPETMKGDITEHGIRNALLISIAPTGTISLFAKNVSSGIEPIFAASFDRKVLQPDGSKVTERVTDYAVKVWEDKILDDPKAPVLPPAYVDAQSLDAASHVRMQAAAQLWVDSSISKTINLPENIGFEAFKEVYMDAYESGCKGCTTYRPNEITGSILSVTPEVRRELTVKEVTDALNVWLSSGEKDERADKAVITRDKLDSLGLKLAKDAVTQDQLYALIELTDGNVWADIADKETEDDGGIGHPGFVPPKEEAEPEPVFESSRVDHREEQIEARPKALSGTTYKLKFGDDDHATYVTINDITEGGRRRPFEIFINSKNMQHYAWTVALTRMISAVFRRPHDSRFVAEELKAVFDPNGGAWMGGGYVPSIIAAIGTVIESHMKSIGYIGGEDDGTNQTRSRDQLDFIEATARMTPRNLCPRCHSANLKNEAGCKTCLDCGYSKCG